MASVGGFGEDVINSDVICFYFIGEGFSLVVYGFMYCIVYV